MKTLLLFAACSMMYGGIVTECENMVDALPPNYVIPPGNYYSAATWQLTRAACVSRGARFFFHAAHPDKDYTYISPEGNETQRRVLSSLPNLLSYLDSVGAFNHVNPHFVMTASQIASIEPRVRLCNK